MAGLGYLIGMGFFGIEPNENPFSKWAETWRGGVNSFFEWVAPNDTVYNVTNSILDMAVSCIPVVGDIRDGVEVITGVSMITGEKLSVAERLITAACFFIPLVGASFVRESGQGIVKFIGKHWDEAMQFASKYIDEGITLISKHCGDFLITIAKKGDNLSTVLKRAFNFGDELEFAGVGTLKVEPENSTKLQDFVSKITGNVDDVSSTVKGVTQADERLTSLTKEQLKGKPKNSPNPDKWFKKNGTISIDDEGIWTYHDWEGNSVSYPDGYPDFKSAGMVKQEVNIGPFQGYNKDFPRGDELAPNGPISESSTWHHHQDGVTLQEVLTKLHERFRHRGGMSKIKK